ncbi:MAG: hypothetical protein WCF67_00620 [Chitinophagaceae bacterium]
MLNKIFALCRNFYVVLIICSAGCENNMLSKSSQSDRIQPLTPVYEDTITAALVNKQYKLLIVTSFSNDTVDIVDYREDPYSSPIILDQHILFYENDRLISRDKVAIKSVIKQTTGKKKLEALQTPVYQICLNNVAQESYYLVYGSDYCQGTGCPEFIGIYSMHGKTIYQGLSTDKDHSRLEKVLSEYQIQINNHNQCSQVDIFKRN